MDPFAPSCSEVALTGHLWATAPTPTLGPPTWFLAGKTAGGLEEET